MTAIEREPDSQVHQRPTASTAMTDSSTMSRRRRSRVSARWPPSGLPKKPGRNCAAVATPTQNALPVISKMT